MCALINEIIFVLISLLLSYFDFKTYHIPLIPLYIGIISNIVFSLFFKNPICYNVLGMVLMAVFFLFMRIITKGGMGYGDIQYALYCGLISGFPYFIYTSLIAALIGIIMHLCFYKKERKVPFIPSMLLGTICVILFIYKF